MRYQRWACAIAALSLLVVSPASIAPPAGAEDRGGPPRGGGIGGAIEILRGLSTDRPNPYAGPPPPDQSNPGPPYPFPPQSPGAYPPDMGQPPPPGQPGTMGGYPPYPGQPPPPGQPGTMGGYPPYPGQPGFGQPPGETSAGQTTSRGSTTTRPTSRPISRRARTPDQPADLPAPRDRYLIHKKNGDECPQRGMGCAALIINFYPAELGAENGNVDGLIKQLKDVGCDPLYIAPDTQFLLEKKKGNTVEQNAEINTSNAKIRAHNVAERVKMMKIIKQHQDAIKNAEKGLEKGVELAIE